VPAHEAGALHADVGSREPTWLRVPQDVNALVDRLWSSTVKRSPGGSLRVGGVDVRDLVADFGSPLYVLDETDFRQRAAAFREAFADYDVYYAAKAFCCSAVLRWAVEEGLRVDVCSGGELAVALRAGVDPAWIGFHGNNKSDSELDRAVEANVGRVILDSFEEIERLGRIASARSARVPVMIRVTAGVEAHTHEYIATAHEDQKFGFSISEGDAEEAVRRVVAAGSLDLRGLHSHIGSQIFDTSGFEVAARRVLALHASLVAQLGVALPELDLGGGFGIAYTTQDDPQDPDTLAAGLDRIVDRECRALGLPRPRLSVEPGRAVVGPSMCTVYTVGTVKRVALDAGASRLYVSVDGGISDNLRTALYDADYSCTLASRISPADPVLARIVGKHCEAGDIIVMDEFVPSDIASGDLLAVPATGAYCRSMASNYNHVPRPPVVAVRNAAARPVVRGETEDDLLRLDVP
jgi:diaminopimelate decarboxylase